MEARSRPLLHRQRLHRRRLAERPAVARAGRRRPRARRARPGGGRRLSRAVRPRPARRDGAVRRPVRESGARRPLRPSLPPSPAPRRKRRGSTLPILSSLRRPKLSAKPAAKSTRSASRSISPPAATRPCSTSSPTCLPPRWCDPSPPAACAAAAAPAIRPASNGRRSPRRRAPQKYVVCNGDEGDPGAFMDRSVLESDPHSVLEGMAIAGYAVGATQGLHLRPRRISAGDEPVANRHQAGQALGLLGSDIFESPFNFLSMSASAPAPSSAARKPR